MIEAELRPLFRGLGRDIKTVEHSYDSSVIKIARWIKKFKL
jgi:hypothetical protein